MMKVGVPHEGVAPLLNVVRDNLDHFERDTREAVLRRAEPNGKDLSGKKLERAMITAKMVFAKLGFMNNGRYELGKPDSGIAYDLVKVPTGVEIVRSDPVEPVVVVPEVKLDVQDVFQDTYFVRSITPTQLRIWVSGVKRCVEKKEVLLIFNSCGLRGAVRP
jgi:hypothetical protein